MVNGISSLNIRAILPLVTAMALHTTVSDAFSETRPVPRIRVGLMREQPDGSYRVYKETTQIPLTLGDARFRFGFDVEHAEPGNFVGYVVLHHPTATRGVTTTFGSDEVPLSQTPNRAQSTVRTDEVAYDRIWWGDFRIEEASDADLPPGVGPLIVRVRGLYPVPPARRREP